MLSLIKGYIHFIVNWFMGFCRLVENREVGWQTQVRKTGEFKREVQPLSKKLQLLILFNPLTEWIDRLHIFRTLLHSKADHERHTEEKPDSKKQIGPFVDFYKIDMSQFDPSDIDAYPTFEQFFVRKHKEGTRPLAEEGDNSVAVMAADSRVVVYNSVHEATRIWIKGKNFTLGNLVRDEKLGSKFADGSIASFRLSPQDYHRYHCPVRGRVKWWKSIPGDYYAVDPICLLSDINVLCCNARTVVELETEEFGDVLFVAIGAKEVGRIQLNPKIIEKEGVMMERGEEIGWFEFGGSSIIVAFQKGRIQFDEDLVRSSMARIEMDVECRTRLGKATSKEQREML